MNKSIRFVIAASAMSVWMNTSMAAINDAYVWGPSVGGLPSEPVYGPNGTTSWPGWTPFEPGSLIITIGPEQSAFFGLNNLEQALPWTKDILMTFFWSVPLGAKSPILGITQQLPSPGSPAGPWTEIELSLFEHTGEVMGTITPQPAWEYFELKNPDKESELVVDVRSFSSDCVPTPGAIALGAIAGLGGLRSKRRRPTA